MRRLRYTLGVPKRACANRAEWRLVRGQRAQHLSAHYQLECDYGTSFLAIYNEGDAVYLCEGHASVVKKSDGGAIAGVRVIQAAPTKEKSAPETAELVESSEALTAAPESSIAHAAGIAVELTPVAKGDEPTATVEPTATEPEAPQAEFLADFRPSNTDEQPAAPMASATESAEPIAAARPQDGPLVAPVLEPRRREIARAAKALVRDLTFGDSAKALVDEAIWNLEPGDFAAYQAALQKGKSSAEAAQAAGGQLAIVQRRIRECVVKIEALLSHSTATIDVGQVIEKPLEQAVLDIIGDAALTESEKDGAINHLGALQEDLNHGLGRVISPHQAHRIARSIGDRAGWGTESLLREELKPAYRSVFTRVRGAVLAVVPEAHILDERLANLCAAKCEIERQIATKVLRSAAN